MSSKEEFDNKIGRLTKSKAYLEFCEQVYGYRLYLFNMMDKEQLDFVFNSIPMTSQDSILDLGCGSGSILSYLIDKYKCSGVGIDQLENEYFAGKRNESLRYVQGDIDSIPNYNLNPTVAVSIDSLYFSSSLEAILRDLCSFPNCRKYLFYSQYLFDEKPTDRSALLADNTMVARILKMNVVSYETVDFSYNEKRLYERSLTILQGMKQDFCNEGNADLFESKLEESMIGKKLYDDNLASRFLYTVK